MLSQKVDQKNLNTLLFSISITREQARLNSVSLPKTGSWLQAVPQKALGLHMHPKELKINLEYRLGMKVFIVDGFHQFVKQRAMHLVIMQLLVGAMVSTKAPMMTS